MTKLNALMLNVFMLTSCRDLRGLSLEGTLAPEIGKLSNLRSL